MMDRVERAFMENVVKEHSKVCKYIGAGSKKRRRNPDANHHNRGAFKYDSENTRIRNCGVSLFKWCTRNNLEMVYDWNDLTTAERPQNGGRCATGQKAVQ